MTKPESALQFIESATNSGKTVYDCFFHTLRSFFHQFFVRKTGLYFLQENND